MRTMPPPGKRFVRDWKGLRVRSRQQLFNRNLSVIKGTLLRVEGVHGGGGLNLISEPCQTCGVQVRIFAVAPNMIEVC